MNLERNNKRKANLRRINMLTITMNCKFKKALGLNQFLSLKSEHNT